MPPGRSVCVVVLVFVVVVVVIVVVGVAVDVVSRTEERKDGAAGARERRDSP